MEDEKQIIKEITTEYSTTYANLMLTGNVTV